MLATSLLMALVATAVPALGSSPGVSFTKSGDGNDVSTCDVSKAEYWDFSATLKPNAKTADCFLGLQAMTDGVYHVRDWNRAVNNGFKSVYGRDECQFLVAPADADLPAGETIDIGSLDWRNLYLESVKRYQPRSGPNAGRMSVIGRVPCGKRGLTFAIVGRGKLTNSG